MIVRDEDLDASAADVVRRGAAEVSDVSAIVVAAFGDPGVEAPRGLVGVPVVGIGEASLTEAASGGQRFGIAATTPGLIRSIEGSVTKLALNEWFTSVWFPEVDPIDLAADAPRQELELARLSCFVPSDIAPLACPRIEIHRDALPGSRIGELFLCSLPSWAWRSRPDRFVNISF